jgi:hypothetical protein
MKKFGRLDLNAKEPAETYEGDRVLVSRQKQLAELKKIPLKNLIVSRYNRCRTMAQFFKPE